jgi:hypothetical protein
MPGTVREATYKNFMLFVNFLKIGADSCRSTFTFVIPAKAGIQANSAEKQTWILAWRGNDTRERAFLSGAVHFIFCKRAESHENTSWSIYVGN